MRMSLRAILCTLAGVVSAANAVVTVNIVPDNSETGAVVTQLGDGRFRVQVSSTFLTGTTTFTIKGATNDVIEDILISANTGGQNAFIRIEGPTPGQFIDSVEDIDSLVSTATVILNKANVLNDVASIRLNTISGTNIRGDIAGDIVLSDRSGGGTSDINSMNVTGNILGDIIVDHGNIIDLTVGGSIGSVSNKSTIRTQRHIISLIADEIHANISTGPTFSIQFIKTNGTTSAGNFTGSISSRNLTNVVGGTNFGLIVAGDLDGDVTFSEHVSRPIDISGKLLDGRIISIGDDLFGAGDTITLGANGLEGLIVINASNGTGTWIGNVVVGSTTLSPKPYYTQSSASLGGGAVGLARFGFHKTDSEPDWNSTVTIALPTQVKISHYGPVHRTTGLSGVGVVTVERRPIAGGNWVNVSTDFVVDGSTSQAGLRTDILVKPTAGNAYEDGFEYRIQPVAGKLACCHVDGNPDVLWQGTYYQFTIDLQ